MTGAVVDVEQSHCRSRTEVPPRLRPIEAFLQGTHLDTLIVAPCNSCDSLTTAIPLRPIVDLRAQHLTVVPGRVASDMFGGLMRGAAIGAGVGAILAYASSRPSTCKTECGLAWLAVPALGIVGGGTGLILGGITGVTTHRDSYWVTVSLPVSTR